MKLFYSQSTGGFYATEIHGDNVPDDAVEITKGEHQTLLQGQSEGKLIAADENGYPILVDPPAPTAEQIAEQVRAERDAKIEAVRWRIERAKDEADLGVPLTEPLEPLLQHAQALRDVPQQAGFPKEIAWPIEPELPQ